MQMAKKLKKGDEVSWETSQGKTTGKVEKEIVKPIKIKSQPIKASPDDPKILVKSKKTGKPAAHRAAALNKTK